MVHHRPARRPADLTDHLDHYGPLPQADPVSLRRAVDEDVAWHLGFGPCAGAAAPPVLAVPQGAVPAPDEWR